jgi:hypothetical protein
LTVPAAAALFEREAGGFAPTEMTRSPWDRDALSGISIGGLLAVLLDEACEPAMNIARLTVDILGVVPRQRLTARVTTMRAGRQMQLKAAELIARERVMARATALCLRSADSPAFLPRDSYPAPEQVAATPYLSDRGLGKFVRTRPLLGSLTEPGPGTLWAAFDFEVVSGVALRPLVRAAMIGDFGNGVGSVLPFDRWNFANVDIAIHFLRLPRGEWVLTDSVTESSGNGHAVVRSVFADAGGIYGRGFQTLFIAPRSRI